MTDNNPIDRARRLRSNSTGPERKLWNAIRNKQLAGLKFRRQHPIGKYIADFVCDSAKLVIELDGNSHNDRFEYDQRRQHFVEQQGFTVLRIHNDDVLQDLDVVLEGVLLACGVALD